jgi:hypothetical protein
MSAVEVRTDQFPTVESQRYLKDLISDFGTSMALKLRFSAELLWNCWSVAGTQRSEEAAAIRAAFRRPEMSLQDITAFALTNYQQFNRMIGLHGTHDPKDSAIIKRVLEKIREDHEIAVSVKKQALEMRK